MKRVILSVTGTALGLVALLSFKTHSAIKASGPLPAASIPSSTTTTPSTGSSTSTGAPPDPTSSKATSKSSSTTATSASYVGTAVETQYGVVQVKITVSGKKITNVSFVQLTAFDGRSQQINSDAAPILLQETLQAQSANIQSVSGASFTSAGYAQSLQSALDKAGI